MKNITWFWLYSKDNNLKPHIVSESLVEGIKKNLFERNIKNFEQKILDDDKTIFDLPGIMFVDRNYHLIEFDNLTIRIPSTDVEAILEKSKNLGVRKEVGQDYYKLHGFISCLCLSPEQKKMFEKTLENILAEATAIASVENNRFNEALCGSKALEKGILAMPRPTKFSADS